MKKTTDELLNHIKNVLSIEDFLKDNNAEYFNITADQYLRKLLNEKDLKVSQISVNSCLGDYVYKVFNGSRKANRDVYIAIGIAMKLTYNELQLLLRLAKYLMLEPFLLFSLIVCVSSKFLLELISRTINLFIPYFLIVVMKY